MNYLPQMTKILLISALFALAAAGCDSEASPMGDDDEQTVDPSPVDTLVLAPQSFVDTFEVLGTAEPHHTVTASSEMPGRIVADYFDEGDAVSRGQRLFRIDTEVDEAGIDVMETNLVAAERELERLERLQAEGLATDQQVDAARTDLEAAEKNLRQSRISVGRNVVHSPRAGHVAVKLAEAGEFANAGAPLAEIIDYSTIVIYAQVPESKIRYVDSDAVVAVDIPALNTTVDGQVQRVSLRASSTTRTYTAEVHVDNQELSIRPGMRARIHFERERLEEVIIIPRDSILEGFHGREAMVVDGDAEVGPAQVRQLTTGAGTRDEVVVLDGLDPGDRLILRGHRGLIGDAAVRIIDEERQADQSADYDDDHDSGDASGEEAEESL